MTSEERQGAIKRLTQLQGTSAPTYQEVANNLMERFDANARGLIDTLIDLLQRDVDSTDLIDLTEHGLMQMPKDADDEYIHVGDEVYIADEEWDGSKKWTVRCLSFSTYGYLATLEDDSGHRCDIIPTLLTHYYAPTVESVLREFAEKITDSQIPGVHPTYDEAIAEYAEKLRMRGEDEEA